MDRGTCCQGPWPSSTTGPSTNTASSPRKGRLLLHCSVFNTYTHTSLCPLRQFKRCDDNVLSFLLFVCCSLMHMNTCLHLLLSALTTVFRLRIRISVFLVTLFYLGTLELSETQLERQTCEDSHYLSHMV